MNPESAAGALVLFGASGDLAAKKLFPALYRLSVAGRLAIPVVGVASSAWDDQRLREHAHDAVKRHFGEVDETAFTQFARSLTYVSGDYRATGTFDALKRALAGIARPTFYLAIPPSMFEPVAGQLAAAELNRDARVVVEKPFGRDLQSAQELNRVLHSAFPESAVFRIDHFLGKETVQNLLVFRFANTVLEPVWNRRYISSIQVTMGEAFGVEGRGAFYEEVGALRDVVQNHLLQVVALLAMEPPVSQDAEALRNEKVKVFTSMAPIDPRKAVRGQYRGYRGEARVDPNSDVETFVALRLEVDSWRWAGVPFYIRAGKCLPATVLEAVVEFQQPPRLMFGHPNSAAPHPNHLRFRLGGSEDGVKIRLQAKPPGEETISVPVTMGFTYDGVFGGQGMEAYERLLADALAGRATLFARQDGVEQAWRVVTPLLQSPPPVHQYDPGTWGPEAAASILGPGEAWHSPAEEE